MTIFVSKLTQVQIGTSGCMKAAELFGRKLIQIKPTDCKDECTRDSAGAFQQKRESTSVLQAVQAGSDLLMIPIIQHNVLYQFQMPLEDNGSEILFCSNYICKSKKEKG